MSGPSLKINGPYTYLLDFHLGFLLDPEELLGNVAEPAPVLPLVALHRHSRQG